jgi:hypothetical protein
VISRKLLRRLEKLEREATPARKWMIALGNSTAFESNSGPVLTLVLPRTDGRPESERPTRFIDHA